MASIASLAGVPAPTAAPAERSSAPVEKRSDLSLEMVAIDGGTFVMGADEGEFDEKPEHRVTLSPFRISRFEVTVAQYRRFSRAAGHPMPAEPSGGFRDHLPVVGVSWHDAEAFTRWLSGFTGKTYRLPTEAQWSYVAQGGHRARYAFAGKEPSGNVSDLSRGKAAGGRVWEDYDDGFAGLAPIGSFPANRLGVHDLDGNAAEWCRNFHYTYGQKEAKDPNGPETGENKVFRGAAFVTDPWYSRVAQRNFMEPGFRADYLGFRVVEGP